MAQQARRARPHRTQRSERPWQMVKSLARNSVDKWNDEPGPRFAAALAFYTAFTIVPFVVLVVMVSTTFMGEEAIQGDLHKHVGDLIGEPSANGLFHLIDQWRASGSPVLNELVALGVFLLGTVHVMDQLRDALDCIWGLKTKRPRTVMARLRQRFASMSGLLGIAFILLSSLTLSAWMSIGIQSGVGAGRRPDVDTESHRDDHFVRHRGRALRPHIQMGAAGKGGLGRRLDRIRNHGDALHGGKRVDRRETGAQPVGDVLWRSRLAGAGVVVGVLRLPNFSVRRLLHRRLCQPIWLSCPPGRRSRGRPFCCQRGE